MAEYKQSYYRRHELTILAAWYHGSSTPQSAMARLMDRVDICLIPMVVCLAVRPWAISSLLHRDSSRSGKTHEISESDRRSSHRQTRLLRNILQQTCKQVVQCFLEGDIVIGWSCIARFRLCMKSRSHSNFILLRCVEKRGLQTAILADFTLHPKACICDLRCVVRLKLTFMERYNREPDTACYL